MSDEVISAEIVTAPNNNSLDVQERANIDLQIQTAKAYPRTLTRFKEKAKELATYDEVTAESCIYRRPVGKDKSGRQTFAEGMSVRLAEIVFSCFGNLRAGSRVVEQTESYVKAQGVCHDLENNVYVTCECIESTIDKNGKPYPERMRVLIAKVAAAKAFRDAIFKVVPRGICKPIEDEVRKLLYGDAKSISKRREIAKGWIKSLGIDEERVYFQLGVGGIDDIGEKELEILTGIKTSIKDGDTKIDDAFPPIKKNAFERALDKQDKTETPVSSSIPVSSSVSSDTVVSSGGTIVMPNSSGGVSVNPSSSSFITSGGSSSTFAPVPPSPDEIELFK